MDASAETPRLHRSLRAVSGACAAWRSGRGAAALAVGGVLILAGFLTGCGSDTTGPGFASTNQLYWALQFNWNAMNMALQTPYDTVQLTATPVTPTGALLQGAGEVQYQAVDSTVTVSPTGLVTAHYVTNQTQIAASLTVNGVTHVDTVRIRVTATPVIAAPLATLSIQPKPDGLDSAKVALDKATTINPNGTRGTIPVYATIATGDVTTDTVCNIDGCPLLVAFNSSDPSIATLDTSTGRLTAIAPGHVTFTAATLVYGVGKRDSLRFTIGYRSSIFFNIVAGGTPSHVEPVLTFGSSTIGVGGRVGFLNNVDEPLEVSFLYQTLQITQLFVDDPLTHQLTDTLPADDADGDLLFRVDSVGTYTFHATLLNSKTTTSGTIIVSRGP